MSTNKADTNKWSLWDGRKEGWKEGGKGRRMKAVDELDGLDGEEKMENRVIKRYGKKSVNSVLVCVCAESGIKESCFSVGPLTALHTILRANKQRVAK